MHTGSGIERQTFSQSVSRNKTIIIKIVVMSFNLHSLALTYAFYVDTQGLVLVKLAALT